MNTRPVQVSLTVVAELLPPRGGRASLMIDNDSADTIKYDFGTAPNDYSGITLESGVNAEWESGAVPQATLYIRGSVATPQNITVTETARRIDHGKTIGETVVGAIGRWFNGRLLK